MKLDLEYRIHQIARYKDSGASMQFLLGWYNYNTVRDTNRSNTKNGPHPISQKKQKPWKQKT